MGGDDCGTEGGNRIALGCGWDTVQVRAANIGRISMTPDQDTQFTTFGCVCRSLLWLANHRKTRAMTKEQFIDAFSLDYPNEWGVIQKCGITNSSMMLEIARKLKLPPNLQIYRSPSRVRDHFNRKETDTVLLITEKRSPAWDDFIHCRLIVPPAVLPFKGAEWCTVEVDSTISLCNMLTIKDSELDLWGAYFCVFS